VTGDGWELLYVAMALAMAVVGVVVIAICIFGGACYVAGRLRLWYNSRRASRRTCSG
jgi:hypothetical protein